MDRPIKIVVADTLEHLGQYAEATCDADLVVVPGAPKLLGGRATWGHGKIVRGTAGHWGSRGPVAVAWGPDPSKVLAALQGLARPRKVAVLTKRPADDVLAEIETVAYPVIMGEGVYAIRIGRDPRVGEVAELLYEAELKPAPPV
jgi:hypothetical protein